MEGSCNNFHVTHIQNHIIKICHGAYITPAKLKKMDPSSSDLCWHGCGQVGILIHMLWHCPAVKVFWKEVVHSVSLIIQTKISPCPLVGLLGYRTAQVKPKKDWEIGSAFLAAKRLMLLNWRT